MNFKTTEQILKELIKAYEYEDAIFFAENCLTEGAKSTKIYFLLSSALHNLGKAEKALSILKLIDCPSHESNFLYLKLLVHTKKYNQAEIFMNGSKSIPLGDEVRSKGFLKFGNYYPSALKLMARYKKSCGDIEEANMLYASSFKENPFLWTSFENLAHFRDTENLLSFISWPTKAQDSSSFSLSNPNDSLLFPGSTKASSDSSVRSLCTSDRSPYDLRYVRSPLKSTPLTVSRRKCPAIETKVVKKLKSSKSTASPLLAVKKLTFQTPTSSKPDFEKRVTNSYQMIGEFIEACEKYDLASAEVIFKRINKAHQEQCYSLSYLASLHYHNQNFDQAKRLFDKVRMIDPYWTKHMDICSSNLWQLNDLSKLEATANFLTFTSPLQHETWICAGNFASLSKKTTKALAMFKRAKLLKPSDPYSYSLYAQELAVLENHLLAESYLQNVVLIDPLHYQAWFSLGRLKAQQQFYSQSVEFLQKSYSINPHNDVIASLLSHCLSKVKRFGEACDILRRASEAKPHNLIFKFEKASILYESGDLKESLAIVNELLSVSRYDSNVLLLSAKIHFDLEEYREATECATRVLSQGKYTTNVETEAKELLKSMGVFQSGGRTLTSNNNVNFSKTAIDLLNDDLF